MNFELCTIDGICKTSKNVKRDVEKIPPALHGFSNTCISIDCVGFPPGRRGGASAGSFDLMQYCYNPGKGWRETAQGRGWVTI
jgi:hypothetical protein